MLGISNTGAHCGDNSYKELSQKDQQNYADLFKDLPINGGNIDSYIAKFLKERGYTLIRGLDYFSLGDKQFVNGSPKNLEIFLRRFTPSEKDLYKGRYFSGPCLNTIICEKATV